MRWVSLSCAIYIYTIGITTIGLAGLFTALYWIIEHHIGG
jgi:hypothetical protein